MKVSIIVPVYNVAPYIEECLNSVIAQSYKGDMECIIVDDCGTDDSIAICERIIKEYGGNIEFSIVHREKNGGLSAARNSGLDVAKGEYIYFLDSDDWIDPDTISTLVEAMSDGTSVVAFGYKRIDEQGVKVSECNYPASSCVFSNDKDRTHFIFDGVFCGFGWEAWGRMYSRDIIVRNNLRFVDNSVIFAEDLCFFICYLLSSNSFKSISKVMYNYRQRCSSIMQADRSKFNFPRFIRLNIAILDYIQNNYRDNTCYHNFYPLLCYKVMEIDILNNKYVDYPSWLIEKSPIEEKIFITRWFKKLRYNYIALEFNCLYDACILNMHINSLLGGNKLMSYFDRLLLWSVILLQKLRVIR